MLICAACGIKVQELGAVTPTSSMITSTLPATQTLIPSQTPLPPLPAPTFAPVTGITSTSINVRSAPSTASDTIGIVTGNSAIQIVGKDPGGNWWQILYPLAQDGKGWVTAQYVKTAGKSEIPVVGAVTNPEGDSVAIIQQKINIRSGPGTNFNSIGTLNPQDVVSLIGKDANGAWLQIEFASGPDGKGWINAVFAQAKNVEKLPIVTEGGQVVGTGTPESNAPPPSPTVVPAPTDNDSANQPLARVVFDPLGTRSLFYSGDVSAPSGDTQDWIGFQTYGGSVTLTVECAGSKSLSVELVEDNQPASDKFPCASHTILFTSPGKEYLLHVEAISNSGSLEYTQYTINLSAGQ